MLHFELHIWNLYDVFNQGHPKKFNQKKSHFRCKGKDTGRTGKSVLSIPGMGKCVMPSNLLGQLEKQDETFKHHLTEAI